MNVKLTSPHDRPLRCSQEQPHPPPARSSGGGSRHSSSQQQQQAAAAAANEVRTVLLYGVPIVALVIEGQERLSLAQISNTLLKDYSYNEIHNRRVALGITCVQCTPVQLELLRRAGAMPVSSRRCGMITKREAERLCKSFLTDTPPPKLPENFAFDVTHQCAWGCRGSFVPARYNSSRAKCIKCAYCSLFFSPNKFIFHSHRLPDSKYVQPDAANFNSWRRHIKLSGTPPEDVSYAWEDVKAMFNGGSRRRVAVSSSSSSSSSASKRARSSAGDRDALQAPKPQPQPVTAPPAPYFPVLPLSSGAPAALFPPPLLCLSGSKATGGGAPVFGDYVWMGGGGAKPYGAAALWPPPPPPPGPPRLLAAEPAFASSLADDAPPAALLGGLGGGAPPLSYASAFRPVAGTAVGRVARSPTLRSSTPACDTTTDPSRAASGGGATGAAAGSEASDGARSEDEDSDSFHGEVDVTDTSSDDGRTLVAAAAPAHTSSSTPPSPAASETAAESRADGGHTPVPDTSDAGIANKQDEETNKRDAEPENAVTSVVQLIKEECRKRDALEASPYSETQTFDHSLDPSSIFTLSKDELRDVLLREAQARKKVERECRLMRETFEEQVQKEVAYREELTKQLQVVRDALCQELDQERKARFAVQAKLKELSLHYQQMQQRSIIAGKQWSWQCLRPRAEPRRQLSLTARLLPRSADTHDTMQHLACKMLGARHCAECSYKAE
ncbi:SKI family transcriptional corepressor fussel [Dermacentor variabilis]|uniref:SKI family transcriptional corepressor fussel n=1 Tax=Dermacentor variabilis TaxID=34621 RepID=UPI003F5C3D6C